MARQRVLVIPHIGTAYGHLIRTGEIVRERCRDAETYVCLPRTALDIAARYLPEGVVPVPYEQRPTVTNASGRLDLDGFRSLLASDRRICSEVEPDLLLGDPGIRAGILGLSSAIPYEMILHGCYLPLPGGLAHEVAVNSMAGRLAAAVWSVAERSLDALVGIALEAQAGWANLRSKGTVLIANDEFAEPCEFGTHLGSRTTRIGFSAAPSPVSCVVTVCSSGDVDVPDWVLREIVEHFGEVTVVGPSRRREIGGVRFTGDLVAIESLVGPTTVVVTHGGHGTLKGSRRAARIIVAPGDLDQLANGLVAKTYCGAEVAAGDQWLERLNGDRPFMRAVDWDALVWHLCHGPS